MTHQVFDPRIRQWLCAPTDEPSVMSVWSPHRREARVLTVTEFNGMHEAWPHLTRCVLVKIESCEPGYRIPARPHQTFNQQPEK